MKIRVHKAEVRLNLEDPETRLPHATDWCALTSEAVWNTNLQGEQMCQIALKNESNFLVLRTKILPHFELIHHNTPRDKNHLQVGEHSHYFIILTKSFPNSHYDPLQRQSAWILAVNWSGNRYNCVNTVPEVSVERRQMRQRGTRRGDLVSEQLEDTEIGQAVLEVPASLSSLLTTGSAPSEACKTFTTVM